MSTTRRVHPACFLLVAASFALLGTACSETKTPTEMVVQPSPVPTPTAASLSGVVKDQAGNPFGGPGNMACVLSDRSEYWVSIGPMGAYSISGLVAGKATVKIYIQGQFIPQTFGVDLQPGANTRDFAVVVQHGE